VEPLLALREIEGLSTKAVAVEDIYSEFGHGEAAPRAIQDYLAYVYHHWSTMPRYVLLLGDATYDFKDYLDTGVTNQVPPLVIKTRYLWTVSDQTLGAVNGEDTLPDVAIGRLPAANVEELQRMVDKILAYESAGERMPSPIVLVADNPDAAGNFVANAEEIVATYLQNRTVNRIYLSELGKAGASNAIVQAFDEGTSLMSYIGHGGIHLWANENIFDIWQVENLSAQSTQPLLLTMNCLNGYFHFPYFNSLAEELLEVGGKGAVAAISPSGLSLDASAHNYHKKLLEQLLGQNHERLGDAFLAAQTAYVQSGDYTELLSIYNLLGDPALKLK
jgi:hypothetical protein